MKQDLLTILDLGKDLVEEILDLAVDMKTHRGAPAHRSILGGKSVATIYEKPSTRTKLSFAVGIHELGGNAIELTGSGSQLSRGETYADTGRVLERYVHGVVFRALKHEAVCELAAACGVPVINALSDQHHPCQILGDLMTVRERLGRLQGVEIAFVGNGSNIVHSLMCGVAVLGLKLRVATPPSAAPLDSVKEMVAPVAQASGATIEYGVDPVATVTGADVVYTDVWFDMGKDHERETRLHEYQTYQLNSALLAHAKPTAVVMHCLPAMRGEEITNEVMDGPQSIVFDQAENRLHIQKAIMAKLLV